MIFFESQPGWEEAFSATQGPSCGSSPVASGLRDGWEDLAFAIKSCRAHRPGKRVLVVDTGVPFR